MSETPPPDPAPRGAGPRDSGVLETRLRAAREAKGMSLTDVQQETRIPADVLQRLEDGRLLGDATFNPVYLRALLKAYASAVGLPADDILSEFVPAPDRLAAGPPHAVVVGTMPRPPAEPAKETPAPREVASGQPATTGAPKRPATPPVTPDEPPAPVSTTPAPKTAGATSPAAPAPAPKTPATPTPVTAVGDVGAPAARPAPAAALGKHRVMRADAARTPRAFDRSWGMIIGGTLALVTVFAVALYFLFRDRTPEPESRPGPVVVDTAAVQDTATVAVEPEAPAGPTLALPIRVTVTAGAGGLQNFRVTAEPNERVGYWIEEGATETFESPTAVVLWGEDAEGLEGEATLELQGLRWAPADGRVLRIDQAAGQRLLDSLAGAPAVPGADG